MQLSVSGEVIKQAGEYPRAHGVILGSEKWSQEN